MLVSKTIEVDMGHRITCHKSKCRNLHGHRYTIEVAVSDKLVTDKGASSEGMVIDYSDLKEIMMKEIDEHMDHGFMIYKEDPLVSFFEDRLKEGMKVIVVPFVPTAENIAGYLFRKLIDVLMLKGIHIGYVKIYETPTSMAIYTRKDWIADGYGPQPAKMKPEVLLLRKDKDGKPYLSRDNSDSGNPIGEIPLS